MGIGVVLLAGDRLPGYHRIDGPRLVAIGPGRGLHLGDVVLVAAGLAVAVGAIRWGRARARAGSDQS